MKIVGIDQTIRDQYNISHSLVEDKIAECKRCGAVIEYSDRDLRSNDTEDSDYVFHYIVCPYCKNMIIQK